MREIGGARYGQAVGDFRRLRRRSALRTILARLRGTSNELLSYDEVRQQLAAQEDSRWKLENIPLKAIVGSVGRYKDFTREFIPRRDSDAARWASVKVAMMDPEGLPPIEAYRIGEAYFVLDGNHRVSVARELDATHIQGYVKNVRTRVSLPADTRPDDLIIKAEHTAFLKHTRLDTLKPGADFTLTEPGRYRFLREQIESYRDQSDTNQDEAAGGWYDEVYLPVAGTIRERGMLRAFPGRTETDLYVWISQHRSALEEELGWNIKPQSAAVELVERLGVGRPKFSLASKLEQPIAQEKEDPINGEDNAPTTRRGYGSPLEVLVALGGQPNSWSALEQAQVIARREGTPLLGLHVVKSVAEKHSPSALEVKAEFEKKCEATEASCKLAIDVGRVAETISKRARLADLVVVNLSHPPGARPVARLSSGFRRLVRRCPRPILAVPRAASPINRALLAYDGSTKSVEALFLATYMAGRWQIPLVVVTVGVGRSITEENLNQAGKHIEGYDVEPVLVYLSGNVAASILQAADEHDADLLLMGGYGRSQVREVVLGSTVDAVLRESRIPILISS